MKWSLRVPPAIRLLRGAEVFFRRFFAFRALTSAAERLIRARESLGKRLFGKDWVDEEWQKV